MGLGALVKKLLFILNPRAGMRKANKVLAELIYIFNRAGYRVDAYVTAGQSDAARVAAQRAGEVDLVVCCGGDGTFNEVVSGLLGSGSDTPMGYIPAGSTNDFASSLKLPTNFAKAAQQIVNGSVHQYDVGLFGNRYFSYVASFGMFTKASYATSQEVKNALGHMAYLLEGIQEVSQLKPVHVRLELDGDVVEDDFLFGAICNSTSVGGILTLDPKQVDMSDGLFEVFLVRMPKDLASLHQCIWAVQKQQYNCKAITFRSVRHICVTADPNMPWTLDGEREPGHEYVEIKNLNRALKLMC